MLEWERSERMERQQRYFEGTQYEDRDYDWDGSFRPVSDAIGSASPAFPPQLVPMARRRPPSVYRLGKIIVQRYTALLFGEAGFPELHVEDDQDTEDFVRGVAEAADLPQVFADARDLGGQLGTAVLSYAWVDGEPSVEVHNAAQIVPLAWENPGKRILRQAVKVWVSEEASIAEDGTLEQRDVWMAREWTGATSPTASSPAMPGADRLYRYQPEDRLAGARWELIEQVVVDGVCPVVWILNERKDGSLDGRGDFEGQEGMLDALNFALCATSGGTARNADPTLVLGLPPEKNSGEPIRKGGHNVIFAGDGAGGTKYLEISGSSTTAGLDVTDRLKSFALEDADVTLLDPEKMSGAAQSGEALRRLLFPMVKRAQKFRTQYGIGIRRVLEGLVDQARRLGNVAFRLPPIIDKVTEQAEDGTPRERVMSIRARVPGTGTQMSLRWPQMFPASASDTQAEVATILQANGNKPIISMRTGVETAARIFGVKDVDQELHDILEHEEQMADASAGSFGAKPGSSHPGERDDEAALDGKKADDGKASGGDEEDDEDEGEKE